MLPQDRKLLKTNTCESCRKVFLHWKKVKLAKKQRDNSWKHRELENQMLMFRKEEQFARILYSSENSCAVEQSINTEYRQTDDCKTLQ